MTTTHEAYINALLADATYALNENNSSNGQTGQSLIDALKTRMTPTLANFIGSNFEAVTHIDTSDNPLIGSGFDATVWRGIGGEYAGKTYVTFTGSEDVSDFASADLDLTISGAATRQIVDMVNWWLKNKTPAGQLAKQITLNTGTFQLTTSVAGTGILSDVSNVIVNGHSLGGHLASAFARLFANQVIVEHVYTFNSAGFTLNSNNIFTQIESLLGSGISKGVFQENIQTNFFAENGLNVTTRDFENIQLGDRQGLFNEEQTGIRNHYMYKLTDSLALTDAIVKLVGTNFSYDSLLGQGSNRPEASLEGVLDGLRKVILGEQTVNTPIGDIEDSAQSRVSFHENLDELIKSAAFDSLKGKVILNTAPIKGNIGRDDSYFGEFLSLYYLTPFTIRTLDSAAVNILKSSNPVLSALWKPTQSADNPWYFSQMWLADRAAMLSWVNKRNANDSALVVPSTGLKQAFEDRTTGTLLLTGEGEIFNRNQYIFGSNGVDQISGGEKADHLYGMSGNDTINGGGGNDYLEGNSGDDTLKGGGGNDSIYGGDGADTLNGEDGADTLRGEDGIDYLYGGNGSDTLIGGQGNDYLNGGLGDDFYLVGDGDIIEDSDGNGAIIIGNSLGDLLRTSFTGGIKTNGQSYYTDSYFDARYEYIGADLKITYLQYSQLIVKNFKNGDLGINLHEVPTYGVNLNVSPKLNAGVEVFVDDYVNGTEFNDSIRNVTGGFDQIFTGAGSDRIITGAVFSTNSFEGGDLVDAGADDDSLWLVGTNNTVIFNANSGSDRITLNTLDGRWGGYEYQKNYVGLATLNLNLSVFNSSDVVISSDSDEISDFDSQPIKASIRIISTGQNLKLFSLEDFNLNITYSNGAASIVTSSLTTIRKNGTDYSDDISTMNNNGVSLFGFKGNDVLSGAGGDDLLDGGAGSDVLSGGLGNDTYQFGIGYGLDYVRDDFGQNTIKFLNGISPESVVVEKSTDSKLVFHLNAEDILTVRDFKNISSVNFADGTVWSVEDFSEPYYAGDDQIYGTNSSDTLYGYLGDDNIAGNEGDDIISGGQGADNISGGLGSDTYLFNIGDGADTISEFSESSTDFDMVQMGTGISSSDIKGIRSGQDLILKIGNNEDQITIKNWYQSNSYRIEQIKFVDEPNVSWDVAKIEAITNTPPTAVPLTLAMNEDTTKVVTLSDFGFSDEDLENSLQSVKITSLSSGSLKFNGVAVVANQVITAANINSGLLTFTPSVNMNGGMSIGFKVSDGTAWSVSESFLAINVMRVNDAPTAINLSASEKYTENVALDLTDIVIMDIDSNVHGVSLMLSNPAAGTLSTGTFGGVTSTYNVMFGVGYWNAFGATASVNALLAGLTFTPTANYTGSFTITTSVSDGVAEVTGTKNFNLANSEPTITNMSASEGYTEDIALNLVDMVIVDSDSTTHTATLTLSNVAVGALNTATSGSVTSTYDATTGVWVASGATADVNALLAGLTFTPNSNYNGNFTIATSVSDGVNTVIGNKSFTGVAVNDAPTAINLNETEMFRRNTILELKDIVVTDIDSPTHTVTMTLSNAAAGKLSTATIGGVTSTYNTNTGVWSASGATADINTLLAGLTFTPTTNFIDSFNVIVTISDGIAVPINGQINFKVTGESIDGTSANDNLLGTINDDIINGFAGDDYLDGGAGVDTLVGGDGNDIYIVDSTTDNIIETSTGGTDTVQSSVTYILGASSNLENLTLTGTSAINGTGNTLDNVLTGNSANNTLNGGAGNDTLNGGNGTDTLVGGDGNDIYIVDSITDTITETSGGGTDTVQSSVTYTLGASSNLENLTLTGTTAINGTGNSLNNFLVGNSANNTLNGGAGNDTLNGGDGTDTLVGGDGNDTYIVDSTTDTITETSTGGVDTVQSSVTYTLGAASNLENLTLTGTAAVNGTGNTLNNVITGNSAANILNGGAGVDTLVGGDGNDIYVVDSTTDTITETTTGGIDTVQSSVTYTLGATSNLENLTLTGTTAINGTGNGLDNVLTGNSANNTLNGGDGNDTLNGLGGSDTMVGGLGDDTYTVDVTGDVVTEASGAGTDTVNVAISTSGGTYTLGANVENGTLTNTVAFTLTGNALNNILTGNAAANTLNGGDGNDILNGLGGNDTMVGGLGNDTYTIDATGDVVTEAANAGTDTVNVAIATSSGTYTVAANVENAFLANTVAYNLTGNALANYLRGNAANNTFTDSAGGNDVHQGLAGNDSFSDTVGNNLFDGGIGTDTITAGSGRDIIIGGLDNDTITTGTGYDVILFNKGDGADTINASVGTDNTLSLGGNFAYSDLSLTKSSNDLILKMGTSDQITLKGWYDTSANNKSVLNLQVIAEAMQGFSLGGSDTLRNNKVETFNFANLVSAFDAAGATANWQLTDARLTAHLSAGNDAAAIGGDIAYQYGKAGSLTGVGLLAAQAVMNNASVGQTAQTLNASSSWAAETIKLS